MFTYLINRRHVLIIVTVLADACFLAVKCTARIVARATVGNGLEALDITSTIVNGGAIFISQLHRNALVFTRHTHDLLSARGRVTDLNT